MTCLISGLGGKNTPFLRGAVTSVFRNNDGNECSVLAPLFFVNVCFYNLENPTYPRFGRGNRGVFKILCWWGAGHSGVLAWVMFLVLPICAF